MTSLDLVRKHFPDCSEEWAEYVLWERTGYPEFFEGDDPVEYFGNQIAEFRAMLDAGKTPCDLCSKEAEIGRVCKSCHEALHS